jgi:pimeloyl-ACP methyl ester carboxylesterase
VHGAWHGAWCFDRVVPLLHTAGIDATAVDLPGHGEDPGPFTDLAGDVARVVEVLDALGDDVVLLGHSYASAVITEAGAHPSVRHLVYLSGFPLDEGESCVAAAADDPDVARISHAGRPSLGDALITHDDGTTTLTGSGATQCLYNDCDDDTVTWALAHLGAHPMLTLSQSPRTIAWRERLSTYVVCTEDLAVHPELQRVLARRCTQSHEWPTSHSPFASRPDLVAALLIDLSRNQ